MVNPPLQCFTSSLYASPAACDDLPRQCIAPTTRETRCLWKVDYQDLAKAAILKRGAQNQLEGDERNGLIRDFVLLHCCVKQHRWRLEEDDGECLEQLIRIFGAAIGSRSVSHHSDRPSPAFQPQNLNNIDSFSGMQLRSRTVRPHYIPLGTRIGEQRPYFIPYKSDPTDSIRGDLLAPIPGDWAPKGEVYCFTWPRHTEYIKIGFTGRSAASRVEEWQVCHPGSTLHTAIYVEFLRRIERLIHLEMAAHRHRIAKCTNCSRSHEEWFKVSVGDANSVIRDWVMLVDREAFYNSDRCLTRRWRARITSVQGDITAKTLHALLDAEIETAATEAAAAAAAAAQAVAATVAVSVASPAQLVSPTQVPNNADTDQIVGESLDFEDSLVFFNDFWRLLDATFMRPSLLELPSSILPQSSIITPILATA